MINQDDVDDFLKYAMKRYKVGADPELVAKEMSVLFGEDKASEIAFELQERFDKINKEKGKDGVFQ